METRTEYRFNISYGYRPRMAIVWVIEPILYSVYDEWLGKKCKDNVFHNKIVVIQTRMSAWLHNGARIDRHASLRLLEL